MQTRTQQRERNQKALTRTARHGHRTNASGLPPPPQQQQHFQAKANANIKHFLNRQRSTNKKAKLVKSRHLRLQALELFCSLLVLTPRPALPHRRPVRPGIHSRRSHQGGIVPVGIDPDDHVVHGLRHAVPPLKVHPRGGVADALRQLGYLGGVEGGGEEADLERFLRRSWTSVGDYEQHTRITKSCCHAPSRELKGSAEQTAICPDQPVGTKHTERGWSRAAPRCWFTWYTQPLRRVRLVRSSPSPVVASRPRRVVAGA